MLKVNSTTVTFYCAEKCCYQLNLPALFVSPLKRLEKLFTYMFSLQHRTENEKAIADTEKCLQDAIEQQKESWKNASKDFTDKYIAVNFHYEYTAQQRNRAEYENKKLNDRVKSEKAKYDRLLKVQAIFNKIKEKHE